MSASRLKNSSSRHRQRTQTKQEAVAKGKKGQTTDYIKWRTTENAHAHFGLTQALKRPAATHFVWLQDDVIVKRKPFTHVER